METAFVHSIPIRSFVYGHSQGIQTSKRPSHHPVTRRTTKRCCAIAIEASGNRTAAANGVTNGRGREPIHLMACDMDGTMLNSSVGISARNITTAMRLIDETDVMFVPATGKSRAGAVKAMGALGEYLAKKYPAGCPGVFLQGLIVFGTDGHVVYENKCEPHLSRAVVNVAEELELSLLAYSRDSILCAQSDEFIDLLPSYHEPVPEVIGDWDTAIGKRPLNKFIYMAEPSRIDAIRPFVAERIGDMGHLTQAQGNMLEVLPPNTSKGYGVSQLLNRLGVKPENLLAIGDAENDLELLQMAGYSCAVANALPSVKAVARYTDLSSNDDDGVAEAIERFVLSMVDAAV